MADSLKVDAGTMGATVASLVDAGAQVPTTSPLELADCGSSAVAAAATNFNERAKKFAALLALQLADIGNDAQRAADSWDAQEAALATNAAGATP